MQTSADTAGCWNFYVLLSHTLLQIQFMKHVGQKNNLTYSEEVFFYHIYENHEKCLIALLRKKSFS